MDLTILSNAVTRAWSRDTSYDAERWTPSNPAWGHCAVTALIVHDFFGGEIVRVEAILPDGSRIPHYYNRFTEREENCDLTWNQFPKGTIVSQGPARERGGNSLRDHILAYEDTVRRYIMLKAAVMRELHGDLCMGEPRRGALRVGFIGT